MLYLILFIFGSFWGSFLNVVACRLQKKRAFIGGRSMCPKCGKNIHWHDLFPLISWISLGGKCRFCKKPISVQYLLVEVATGLLFALGLAVVTDIASGILYLAVISFFVILFVYDSRTYIIPDKIVLPAIVIIFAVNALATGSISRLILGGLLGGLWFLIQFVISRGRWVGGGDIRLGIMMGVLLGHPLIWLGLGLAYVGGSIIALLLILTKQKSLKSRLPFATLLLPATFIVWIWGIRIWEWYSSIIGL
ncbi:MAG: prepilin peptidase [Patescibacteria group bacterium]|jgi:prepilin signal peptidase PulO-like enzyme (type II secretory pathway)|nr:prepilin peptidase [Patescibacteria group bacterium]|tara:strand:+ start:976 stop:1725 length:750 start_codon:yes stop_codon:yes gene_type:complete